MVLSRHQNAVTTKSKIKAQKVFKQIPSNFQGILLKKVRTWRTINERIRKMKQNEIESNMGIIKLEFRQKITNLEDRDPTYINGVCLKRVENLKLK